MAATVHRLAPPERAPAGPANIEAEQAVLASALVNSALVARCSFLAVEDFFEPVHGRIWAAIRSAVVAGRPADEVALGPVFDADHSLDGVDGRAYLAQLAASARRILDAEGYAREIVRLARQRRVAEIARDLAERAREPGAPSAAELVADAVPRLEAAGLDHTRKAGRTLAEVASELADDLLNPPDTFSTGISLLDQSIGGFDPRLRAETQARQEGLAPGDAAFARRVGELVRVGTVPFGYVLGVEARPAGGKAQPVGEPVLLADGAWRSIGELKLGDRLASPDGAPSEVVGVFPQGRRSVFRLRLSDGRSVAADGEHLWSVRTKDTRSGHEIALTITTAQIAERLKNTRPLWLPLHEGEFGSAELPLDPYLLGALIGDGCLHDKYLMFSTGEPAMLALMSAALPLGVDVKYKGGADYYLTSDKAMHPLRKHVATHPLRIGLVALGLSGKKSADKFIPEICFRASRADRLSLLQGLLDTDGEARTGAGTLATVSRTLAFDIQRLAWSLGLIARLTGPHRSSYRRDGTLKECQPHYKVSVMSRRPKELFRLPRKVGKLVEVKRFNARLRIESVEPLGEDECVCIAVSHPSRLYVTRDYVLTHNTMFLHTVALNAALAGVPAVYFAAEMGARRLTERMLGHLGGFKSQWFRHRDPEIASALARVHGEMPPSLVMEDCPGVPFGRLRQMASEHLRRRKCRLFVLDYYQLVTADGRMENKVQHLEDVAGWLAKFAYDHGVTWLVASQQNRDGFTLSGDGLLRSCDWLAQLNSPEEKGHHEKFGRVRTVWLDVRKARDGTPDPVGSPEEPLLFFHPHGPHLAELPQ